ncbi:MAG: hypothetical protein PHD61_10135 [Bacteroidales bacterium]|nr:hypothetical protein [Lentimicrobiaceae bacterium]MDD5695643.1 hypothetical protein [Bacteroidales bacterium]
MVNKNCKLHHCIAFIIISLLAVVLMTGCEDEEPEIYDFSTVSDDFLQSYVAYFHLFFHVDQMLKSVEDSLVVHPEGSYAWRDATVSIQPAIPAEYPKTFRLDFGTTGADDVIAGAITGVVSADYLSEGAAVTYTFEDVIINRDRPSGSCSVTNEGLSSGKQLFHFEITDNTLVRDADTDTAYAVLLAGFQNVLWSQKDDVLTIPTGTYTGQSLTSDSLRFMAEVDPDYKLIKDSDCDYIRDGIFDFRVRKNTTNTEIGDGVVDFGFMNPMDCDQYVIAVVDGEANRTEFVYLMDWVKF